MPSSKQIKNILKWILIICILLFIIISISSIMNNHDESMSDADYNFNLSHDEGVFESDDGNDYDNEDMNNSNIATNENSNQNFQGVDDSPYTLAKNDPDWYYDHYDYGDYDEIDEYLESQGYE